MAYDATVGGAPKDLFDDVYFVIIPSLELGETGRKKVSGNGDLVNISS